MSLHFLLACDAFQYGCNLNQVRLTVLHHQTFFSRLRAQYSRLCLFHSPNTQPQNPCLKESRHGASIVVHGNGYI